MEPQATVKFKCERCHKTFSRKHSLKVHVMVKHTEVREHECDMCGARFDEKRNLERHKQRHSTAKNYKCEVCEESFFDKLSLSNHTLTHLNNMKSVLRERSLTKAQQLEDITAAKEYQCDMCGKHFLHKGSMQRHMKLRRCKSTLISSIEDSDSKLKHKISPSSSITSPNPKILQNRYSCTLCGRSYSYQNSLERHVATHTGSVHYRCDVCGADFRQKSSMTRHKQRHSGIRKHKCDLCGKSFIRNHDLTVHKLVHAGIKNHKCHVCGMAFTRKVTMLMHFKSTHKGKIYQCDICRVRFTHKLSLEHHKLRKHGAMEGFKFESHENIADSKQALTEHGTIEASSGTAPKQENAYNIIQQRDTSQSFLIKEEILEDFINNNRDTLSITSSQHTAHSITNIHDSSKVSINGLSTLRKFQCNLCDSAFSRKQYLTQHMRKHEETKTTTDKKSEPKRKHQCYVCGNLFAHRRSMLRHRSRHSEIVRMFRCEICETDFFDEQAFAEHSTTHGAASAKNCGNNALTDAVDSITQTSTPTQSVLIKEEPLDGVFPADPLQENLPVISVTPKQHLKNNLLTNVTDSMTQQTLSSHKFPSIQNVRGRAVTQPFAGNFSKVQADQKLYEPPAPKDDIALEQHARPSLQITIKHEITDSGHELNTCPVNKEFPRNLFEEVTQHMDKESLNSNVEIHCDRPGKELNCKVGGEAYRLNCSLDSLSSDHSDFSSECEVGGKVHGQGHKTTHNDLNHFKIVVCGEALTLKNQTHRLMSSRSDHTNVYNLECHVCGGLFTNKTSLEEHISAHNDGRDLEKEHFQLESTRSALVSTLECGFCSKIFDTLNELTDHLLQHNETRIKLRRDILSSVS